MAKATTAATTSGKQKPTLDPYEIGPLGLYQLVDPAGREVAAVPELPTVNEALGLKDYELIAYFAMYVPAGTPADVIAKLNKAANAAASSKEVQEKFAGIGFAVEPGTPEDLAKRGATETAKWAKAIKDAKIEPQ